MGYLIDEGPLDVNALWKITQEIEESNKAWHHSVRERPDRWGFDLSGVSYGAHRATFYLVFEWNIHESKRPRYTRLKHIRRIIDMLDTRLHEEGYWMDFDPFEVEIDMSEEKIFIKQSVSVVTHKLHEELMKLGELEGRYT